MVEALRGLVELEGRNLIPTALKAFTAVYKKLARAFEPFIEVRLGFSVGRLRRELGGMGKRMALGLEERHGVLHQVDEEGPAAGQLVVGSRSTVQAAKLRPLGTSQSGRVLDASLG